MAMGWPGPQELLIVFLIILLLFGARRIPEVGRSLGKGIREFKRATKEISSEVDLEDGEGKRETSSPRDQHSSGPQEGPPPAG